MSRTAHPRARTHARPIAPRHPRRMSGPVRRPAVAAGPALPARRVTGAFERIRALPDHRLVDGLLRSQAWIWVIGIALGGIVFMQVHLLKLNAGIGRAVETSSTLERQNAALKSSVVRLSAGQHLQEAALRAGLVTPAAGSVEYVRTRGLTDAEWATRRMRAPSDAARALMASGGIPPAPVTALVAAPGAVAPAPATAPVTTPPAVAPVTTTPPPVETPPPPVQPAAAPALTAAPVAGP